MQNTIILTKEERNVFLSLIRPLHNISPSNEMDLYMSLVKNASIEIPYRIKKILNDFKEDKYPQGVLLFRNIPVDEYNSKTPLDNTFHIGEDTIMSKIQAIINTYIGEMVSYEAEGDGRLFQDMVPNKKLAQTQTSLGSKVELELHTEQAFSDCRPDYLSLACLKGDSKAKTYYLHVNDVVNKMQKDVICYLQKKRWFIGVDASFIMNGCNDKLRGPISIIEEKCKDNYNFVFDQDLMIGSTDDASKIMNDIISIYYEYRSNIILSKGDLLILDNNKVVHGRSNFSPKFDGNDRFVIRSFIINSFDKIHNKTTKNARMVAVKYS